MKWPSYFKDSKRLRSNLNHETDYYTNIILCGMGGSATSSDVLQEILNIYGIVPAITLRGQPMPSFVNKRSLVLVNSVSGNTTESLLMLKDAITHGAEVIAISSGGRLKEDAKASGCKHIEIPNIFLPRASFPYLLTAGLNLINRFLRKSLEPEMEETSNIVANVLNSNNVEVSEEHSTSKQIARFMICGFPVCYSSPILLPAATRFKASMNENAKLHCLKESTLEASHNDIVPFTYNQPSFSPKVLNLRWNYYEELTRNRFDKVVQDVMEIRITENSRLHALVSAITILDLSTIYIAIARNTDPSPTPAIQILKDFE